MIWSEPYLWFGNLAITLLMLKDLNFTDGLKYAEQNLVGRKPTLQCTGSNLRKLTSLKLTLDHSFCDIEQFEETLLKMARTPTAYPLMLDSGKILGEFVITAANANYRQTGPTGHLMAAEYTLSLSEYVKPQEQTVKNKPAVKAGQKSASTAQQKSSQTPKTPGSKAQPKATTAKEIARQP